MTSQTFRLSKRIKVDPSWPTLGQVFSVRKVFLHRRQCRLFHQKLSTCFFSSTHLETITLQGTNISPKDGFLKMSFLFPRWDMLVPWRVVKIGSFPQIGTIIKKWLKPPPSCIRIHYLSNNGSLVMNFGRQISSQIFRCWWSLSSRFIRV